MTLVGEPDAVDPLVRFDEREVETEQGGIFWPRQPKGPATRMAHLNHRATSRLYPQRAQRAQSRLKNPGEQIVAAKF